VDGFRDDAMYCGCYNDAVDYVRLLFEETRLSSQDSLRLTRDLCSSWYS